MGATMDRREQRVYLAVAKFSEIADLANLSGGSAFVVYVDGERIAMPTYLERARMALREAVLMAEANGVRCE
jgi:hypothetical protein